MGVGVSVASRRHPLSQSVRFPVAVWCSCPQTQSALVEHHTAFCIRLRASCQHCSFSHLRVRALCPSRRVKNDSSNFASPRSDKGSQTMTDKKACFFFVESFIVGPRSLTVVPVSRECLETRTQESNMCAILSRFSPSLKHGPRRRNMCASFSGVSPVWNQRRQEESCGSLVKAQASERVDLQLLFRVAADLYPM